MKIWIFKNSYYCGDCEEIIKKADRSEDIEVPDGKMIVIDDYEIKLVDSELYKYY